MIRCVRRQLYRRPLRLHLSLLVVVICIFPESALSQLTSFSEVQREKLPSDLIPELILDVGTNGILIGQRGVGSLVRFSLSGERSNLRLPCGDVAWFAQSSESRLLVLDTARLTISESTIVGKCAWKVAYRPVLPVIRDLVLVDNQLLLLTSDKPVWPQKLAIQVLRLTDSGLRPIRTSEYPLSKRIRRPVIDRTQKNFQITDRQYPFANMVVNNEGWRIGDFAIPVDTAAARIGVVLDSLWVALPPVLVRNAIWLSTLTDLRSDRRLLVQRDCKGKIMRVTALDGLAVVLFHSISDSVFAVQRNQEVTLVRYSFQLTGTQESCES